MRLTQRQLELAAARAKIETALAADIAAEFAKLWRRIYPSMRRLEQQRPAQKAATGRQLRKAISYTAQHAIWDNFQQAIVQRVTEHYQQGTLALNDIHNAWAAKAGGAGYQAVELDTAEMANGQQDRIAQDATNLTNRARRAVGRAVAEWYNTPELTLEDLENDLRAHVGPGRARTFASTEATRMNSLVVDQRMEKLGLDEWIWNTKRDEITCRECREKHGRTFHRGDPMPPEGSHPNCRCDAVEVVKASQVVAAANYQQPPAPAAEPQQQAQAEPAVVTAPQPAPVSNLVSNAIQQGGGGVLGDYIGEPPEPAPAAAPAPKKAVSFKQFATLKQKVLAGGILTPEEIDALEVHVDKTWPGKKIGWVEQGKAVALLNQPLPTPQTISIKKWTELSTKATKELLTPQELSNVEAFSQHSWGHSQAWMQDHKQGKLKPATVQVVKKPKAQPAPAQQPTAALASSQALITQDEYSEIYNKVNVFHQPLTAQELADAKAFSIAKTGKIKAWITDYENAASQPAAAAAQANQVPPIGWFDYKALKEKAEKGGTLTAQELADAKAYSRYDIGMIATWIEQYEQGYYKQSQVRIDYTAYVDAKLKAKAGGILTPDELADAKAYAAANSLTASWIADYEAKAAAQPASQQPGNQPLSHDQLKQVDLHANVPGWQIKNQQKQIRYGAIVIDDAGNVLLREPANHFDQYVWTHAKGGPDYPGQHPVDIIEREVEQETGYQVQIVGFIPGAFESGYSQTFYAVARPVSHNPAKMDNETWNTKWATPAEAEQLIGQTTNAKGQARDLLVLKNGLAENAKIISGQADYSQLLAAMKAAGQPAPAPAAAPLPQPTVKVKGRDIYAQQKGFPKKVEALSVVRSLGGSTGARLLEDPETGKQYVWKQGNSPDHMKEEAAADAIYQAAGANVPAFQVYKDAPGGPGKLSDYVPNAKPLATFLRTASQAEQTKVKKQLQKHFAADALLGNWDVIGMDADNIMVDEAGNVWRIDNGGSLRMRAQGQPKGDQWNPYPTELWTMRDKARQPGDQAPQGAQAQAVGIFGGMSYKDVCDSIRTVMKAQDKIIATAPAEVRPVLAARLENLGHVADAQETLQKAGWKDDYQDGHGRQIMETRRAGITGRMPQALKAKKEPGSKRFDASSIVDENGRPFDHLRGRGSIVKDLVKRIKDIGGDYEFVRSWMSDQGSSSFYPAAMAMKWHVANNHEGGVNNYWWGEGAHFRGKDGRSEGIRLAREAYEHITRGKEEVYEKTMQAYQAFIYELLDKTDLPNKNPQNKTIRLIRTESSAVIRKAGAIENGPAVKYKRGAADSCSLLNPVLNSQVTLSEIPYSDVLGVYLVERNPERDDNAFLGDGENEFVCSLGKTPWTYAGDRSTFVP